MPRTHYIVRYSKLALVPGRSLTFKRGEEVPASVGEVRTPDREEADKIANARIHYDGEQATITKVHRDGRQEKISHGFSNNGFASPEERERLDVGDILDFVARIARLEQADGQALIQEARKLVAKHDGSCLAKGA